MATHLRQFTPSLLAAALASGQTMAAGFQLNAQSATGIGRAFSGDAVIADNASVMARNPAAMALFDETALSLGFEIISTDITANDVQYNGNPAESFDDAGGVSVAPNMHLIIPVNEQFAWGVNAYSNFATNTDFSDSLSWSEYGGLTDVESVNIGVSASYRLNEQWSFGAGIDIIYGTGKLTRIAGTDMSVVAPGTVLVDADADGFGVGFNLGTVFELDENNRFGLSYRYSPEIEADGSVEYSGDKDSNGTLYMPLPNMAEFSGYHRIKETPFALHYSIQYTGWSCFDKLDAKINGMTTTLNDYNWQDAWHYAIGGTYYLDNQWTLRAGYMYDTSAQDETTSVSVPDSDRQWFSAGATYEIDQQSNIDIGLTYLIGQDVQADEVTDAGPLELSRISATTRANAVLFGLQYNRTF